MLAVIWHHTVPYQYFALPITNRGFLGVDLFFVLSGFLIVTLLLRERARRGAISLRRFYARRTLRIFPVYYALLAAFAALYLLQPNAGSATAYWRELPYYLSYTSNWIEAGVLPIAWSLAAEEQFYLLWPPVERFARRLAVPLILAVIGLSQAVNFGLLDDWLQTWIGPHALSLEIVQATFTPIALGVLLAHALHRPAGFTRVPRWLGGAASPLLVGAALLAAMNWPGEDLSGLPRLSIQLLMALFLASLVLREEHALRRLLRARPLQHLGRISYGMYLFHLYIAYAAAKFVAKLPAPAASPVLTFLFASLATAAVATLSFRYFETPILRWKDRFRA